MKTITITLSNPNNPKAYLLIHACSSGPILSCVFDGADTLPNNTIENVAYTDRSINAYKFGNSLGINGCFSRPISRISGVPNLLSELLHKAISTALKTVIPPGPDFLHYTHYINNHGKWIFNFSPDSFSLDNWKSIGESEN